jgi:hypothetical protein
VFGIFDTEDVRRHAISVGRCVAVSNQHLLSYQLLGDKRRTYRIALVGEKTSGGIGMVGSACGGYKTVNVVKYNADLNYAILALQHEPFDLVPVPVTTLFTIGSLGCPLNR